MHPVARYTRVGVGLLFLLIAASTASAQHTRGYVSGAVFADIRQFSGTSSRGQLPIGDLSKNGTAAGGSVRVGTWLHPRWTLEIGADVSSKTNATVTGPVIAIFPPVPPLAITSSTSFVSVTTMVGFHSPAGSRVRLGYLAGFSFIRANAETEYFSPRLAAFTGLAEYASLIASLTRSTALMGGSSSALSLPALTDTRNSGAITLGVEADIDLTTKISVVPELRATTFSTSPGGSGAFLIRPGVGVRWKF